MNRTSTAIMMVIVLGFGLSLAACAGQGHVRVTGHVDAPRPTLVHIGPGLWVVENHDQPVFYYDDWYWLYADGVWLRSSVYTGSFVRVQASVVPRALVRVDRPRRYVHYRARAGVRVRQAPAPRARNKRAIHDHRSRDHRQERDHRQDRGRQARMHDRRKGGNH